MRTTLVFASLLLASSAIAGVKVTRIDGIAPAGMIEIRGVGAGPLDPAIWDAGALHLLPDSRSPLLQPREGKFRNIYAPSIVQTPLGWDVYYGAWDGVPTGNDRIYRASTSDFLTFGPRETIIEHGVFHHVCNVTVTPVDPGGRGALAMMCTTYPDARGLNKPASFHSSDGRTWNAGPATRAARREDVITITGYEGYDAADINGMNVLLHEEGIYRLYFGNFRDFGKVYRASGTDGKTFAFDGKVLDGHVAVNDVKKIRVADGQSRYLMAMHMNTNRLWYAVSSDGLSFAPPVQLCENLGGADAFIVAVGWVIAGRLDEPGDRVLGFLYGAGTAKSLDANRIFARWLQKRVVIIAPGAPPLESRRAVGPDRQLIEIGEQARLAARLDIFAEDGRTRLGTSAPIDLKPGCVYQMTQD